MPSVIKIRVVEARELPIMDRQRKTTDAYVEVRVAGGDVLDARTPVVRNDLNPRWDYDFRVEVGDEGRLQDTPIEFRIMDSDVLSADDPVGSVYIDINPLLARVANLQFSAGKVAEEEADTEEGPGTTRPGSALNSGNTGRLSPSSVAAMSASIKSKTTTDDPSSNTNRIGRASSPAMHLTTGDSIDGMGLTLSPLPGSAVRYQDLHHRRRDHAGPAQHRPVHTAYLLHRASRGDSADLAGRS